MTRSQNHSAPHGRRGNSTLVVFLGTAVALVDSVIHSRPPRSFLLPQSMVCGLKSASSTKTILPSERAIFTEYLYPCPLTMHRASSRAIASPRTGDMHPTAKRGVHKDRQTSPDRHTLRDRRPGQDQHHPSPGRTILTTVDKIHASIVYDIRRWHRKAAKKGGIAKSRKARFRRIEPEIDAEWRKRDRAS